MTGLARAVRTVVRRCLAIKPGENVLVIVDEPRRTSARRCADEAQEARPTRCSR